MKRPRHRESVVVYPADSNPYQELLYGALEASTGDVRVAYVRRFPKLGSLHLVVIGAYLRLRGFSVLHLHWPAMTMPSWLDPSGRMTPLVARLTLSFMRSLGYHVVWTVHNLSPHQRESGDDARVLEVHARAADVQIVHSQRTANELAAADLAGDHVVVIPHGNYIGRYRSSALGAGIKGRLGIPADAFVFAFIGMVRPYKGVPDLISAFLDAGLPNAFLVVAGRITDPEIPDNAPRVILIDRYVSDEEVADLMLTADVVCVPFRRVTTSGSAILASSFGKPLVFSRVGDLLDFPAAAGWSFEPGDHGGMTRALRQAAQASDADLRARAAASFADAESRDWFDIAQATRRAYGWPTSDPR